MNIIKAKLNSIDTRKRFILYSFLVFILMICSFYLLSVYSSYHSKAEINTKVEKAVYILEEGMFSFNIDIDGIFPKEEPYIYQFSIANYNAYQKSNVDLEYSLSFRTTTNLPIEYQLYRNENYDDSNSTNLFSLSSVIQDEDGSWYNQFDLPTKYTFNYHEQMKDIYYLVVYFPKQYSTHSEYADLIDNVEVIVDAKQIIDQEEL